MKVKQALGKKLGPLPRWGWLLIAVVVLGYLYYRKQQAANATQSSVDPYSSYNTQGYVDQGQPYGDSTSGSYPLGGGLGSGFDPTSFQEGLTYGQGLGVTQAPVPQVDSSVPTATDDSGQTLTPPVGDTVTVVAPHSVSAAGKKGTSSKKQPTANTPAAKANPATSRGTSTGGGQPVRKSGTHTKAPAGGSHGISQKSLAGGGIASNPGRTVIRNNPAPPPKPKPPPPKPKPKPKPPPPPPRPQRAPGRR